MKKILLSFLMLCCMTSAWAQADGFIEVATTIQLWNAIKANDHAKVRLTADFALSDIDKDYETYCNGNTFYGTIDGNGHTIKGDPVTSVRARTYMFYNCSGATFKNLTFKGIRVNSTKNPNQAIITATAKNGCVFENITFDNVHTWTDYDNAGSAAGWAQDCTFKDITVKNSDFTADENQSGCVVGHAIGCTFENIKVENCKSTAAADELPKLIHGKSGGVVGLSDKCNFNNVEVLGSFIKTYRKYVGGIAGYSEETQFTNCVVDDQSCVCSRLFSVDDAYAGGIVGSSSNDKFYNCINSSMVSTVDFTAGGIVGWAGNSGVIDGCLNTGMVISLELDDVDGLFQKYKTKSGMTCVTKTYQGKEYVIRKYDGDHKVSQRFGGIVGMISRCTVSRCANLGSVLADDFSGGIVGSLVAGTICDCVSDFPASDKVNGICGRTRGISRIDNCLNMTTHTNFAAYSDDWTDFKSNDNNYSLTTAEDAHHTTKTTAAKIKSGEICLKLGANWEQNLGTDAYPTPTGDRGIYHMREVYKKEYGTICVPFPLETLKGVGVGKREYYLFNEVKNEADGTISICFKYTDVVPAGTPAIFRAYVYSDYYFLPMEKEYQFEVHPTVGTEWTFNGTYEQKVFDGYDAKSIYYLDGTVDKSAIKNAKNITIAPYRAYFTGPNIDTFTGPQQAKAIRFVLEGENGETTALELVGDELTPVQQSGKAYSLMGAEVGEDYRGLVIRNGKKVIQNR